MRGIAGTEGKKCVVLSCRLVATRHCEVMLGSIPLSYDYCKQHAIKAEVDLYNAGYKPVFTDIKEQSPNAS